MFFVALASDYDGTLAEDGRLSSETIDAIETFRRSGRKLILVTGREMPDLQAACARLDLFDKVVAENGALLYSPASKDERAIAPAPPPALVEELRRMGVAPLSVGKSIIATWEPNEGAVLDAIHRLGLEAQIIFNKGAVMVLPSGVNKATGLAAALAEMGIAPQNVVAVGDAENDHAFLKACGCAVAVSNALTIVKEGADFVTAGARGAGVAEVMERIARNDISIAPPGRFAVVIGTDRSGDAMTIEPGRGAILIAGSSGIGKSTLATALSEHMAREKYQFCVMDPEGDYDQLENAISVGDKADSPKAEEVLQLIEKAMANVVVNTLALGVVERPPFFGQLLRQIADVRARLGRPHWLIIDEAHHLLPAGQDETAPTGVELSGTILITVHPDSIARDVLKSVDTVMALGPDAGRVIAHVCRLTGRAEPSIPGFDAEAEILFWKADSTTIRAVTPCRPSQVHKRHIRKYAEGTLGADRSFYFRGPDNTLNLRAQNLIAFLQIADGVDDATWTHHLQRGDYSTWARTAIKDDALASAIEAVECVAKLPAQESRERVAHAIRERYTIPADGV